MNVTVVVENVLQIAWFAITLTVGTGLTIKVNAIGAPAQEFDIGVTTTPEYIGTLKALVLVNGAILPVADKDANPVPKLVFVQA